MESYERLKVLGVGSFGKVYLVRHRQERTLLCAKIIKIKNIPSKEREACRTEVDLLRRLNHPNIVGYKDSFLTPRKDHLCIIMEYCDGGDLSTQIKNARRRLFSESKILHWFVQIALGLHFMHGHLILHRDLKTQNIFMLGNGRLVLGDLGISKVLEGTMDFASTRIGTPYYMSPEIFENKPYNHKSDIWALGCILYEMVALTHAFDATSLQGLAQRVARGQYPPINMKYSRNLRDLIARMLLPSPAERPDLDEILQLGFIRKHIHNFIADIVSRESSKIGTGTMVLKAAAVNMLADSEGSSNASDVDLKGLETNQNMTSLKKQLEELGLQEEVKRALSPPETNRPTNARVAAKVAKEQASALRREEDRRKAVESALVRLRKERKERLQLRRSKEDEDLPLPACMQQQQQPALPAQDGASKHFRVRNGWQAAVVGVGMGVMDGGKASGQEKNARAGLMSGRPLEVVGEGRVGFLGAGRRREARQATASPKGPGQSPAAPCRREGRQSMETRDRREKPSGKVPSRPQGRQGNFGGQDRDDKRGFGRAALAGVGDGVVNRARNNAVGQPSMYRVRGPDSNSRAREAGRLAVEAMARREETAQREAAKKREEVLLQRERERDRLRQDKVELDRKMEWRDQRRRQLNMATVEKVVTPVKDSARGEGWPCIQHQEGGRLPAPPRNASPFASILSAAPLVAPAVPESRDPVAVAVTPPPALPLPPATRARARWAQAGSSGFKPPYAIATPPESLSALEVIRLRKDEKSRLEVVIDRLEKAGLQKAGVGVSCSSSRARLPLSPPWSQASPAVKDSADAISNGVRETSARGIVAVVAAPRIYDDQEVVNDDMSPRSCSSEEDSDALQWNEGRTEVIGNKGDSATGGSDWRAGDGSEFWQGRETTGDKEEGKRQDRDEADEDLHAREELLEVELQVATSRCEELRHTLQETKSMIPAGALVVVDDRVGDKLSVVRSGYGAGEVKEVAGTPPRSSSSSPLPMKKEARAPEGADTDAHDETEAQAKRFHRSPPSSLTESPRVAQGPSFSFGAVGKETRTNGTGESKSASRQMGVVGVTSTGRDAGRYGGSRSNGVGEVKRVQDHRGDLDSLSLRNERRGRPLEARSSVPRGLEPPRVNFSSPSPPPCTPTGRLADRIRTLRERCRLGLGADAFERAYLYLKAQEDPDTPTGESPGYLAADDREERLVQGLTDILGRNKVHYYGLIDQLIFIENTHLGSG